MLEHINPTFWHVRPDQIGSSRKIEERKKLHATILSVALGFAALLVVLIVFGSNSAGGYKRSLAPTIAVVDPVE